jgi:predicted NBD/HSP70 family sugar kinase
MTPPRATVVPDFPSSANERLVLAALDGGVVASRAQLSAVTGLPKTTVVGIVGRLLRRGLLIERPAGTGPAERHRGRGRPAAGVALASPGGWVSVLALTHTTIRTAAVEWDGTVAAYRDSPMDRVRDEKRVIGRGLALLTEALAEVGLSPTQASCIVVGVPAAFEQGVGAVFGRVPDAVREAVPELTEVFGWLNSDPVPAVSERLGIPATADNDANLGALGEATFGAGRGLDDFIYVKVVEGIGAGLLLGGRLHRGARGLAGELAHVHVLDDGPWCACGSRGCLATTYGGFASVLRSAYPRPLTVSDLRELVASGELATRRITADAGRRVGRVLADVCVMLSPQAIIVDGMLGAAADSFLTGVREMIHRYTPSVTADTVQLLSGELGDRAEILGAVALARAEHLHAGP